MVSNLKLKGLEPEKGPNQIKNDLRVFCENFLLIHYFLVNLRFLPWDSVCFENEPCKTLCSGKNGVWNGSQMMWDSF